MAVARGLAAKLCRAAKDEGSCPAGSGVVSCTQRTGRRFGEALTTAASLSAAASMLSIIPCCNVNVGQTMARTEPELPSPVVHAPYAGSFVSPSLPPLRHFLPLFLPLSSLLHSCRRFTTVLLHPRSPPSRAVERCRCHCDWHTPAARSRPLPVSVMKTNEAL
jgi:hypothetical protein